MTPFKDFHTHEDADTADQHVEADPQHHLGQAVSQLTNPDPEPVVSGPKFMFYKS